MRSLVSVLISVLLLVVMAPVIAQDDAEAIATEPEDSCGAGSILERVDISFTEFQATRTTDDSLVTFNDVENFYNTVGDLLDECRNIVQLAASGIVEVGSGTFDDPYAFDYYGDTGRGYLLKITQYCSPGRPVPAYRWDACCSRHKAGSMLPWWQTCNVCLQEDDFCEVGYSDFRVDWRQRKSSTTMSSYSSSLDLKLRPGGEGSGSVWFLIQK